MKPTSPPWGLAPGEIRRLRSLSPPWRIQALLDDFDYDVRGSGCRSPRRALRERRVQCMDGALLAAAALRVQGHPPLLLDLEADRDDDHVLALFRGPRGGWGAVARSNYAGLRYREPVHPTLRSLALSYLESYFNLRGEKTLRRYSVAVNLARFDARGWMTAEEDLWEIPEHLVGVRHYRLLAAAEERALGRLDRRSFAAGLVGRQGFSRGQS